MEEEEYLLSIANLDGDPKDYIFSVDNDKNIVVISNIRDGSCVSIDKTSLVMYSKVLKEKKNKTHEFWESFCRNLKQYLQFIDDNDYSDFNSHREDFQRFSCPKCGKEMSFYRSDSIEDYLVCNDCEYAKEINKTL